MRRKQLGESFALICSWVAVRWGTLWVVSPSLSHRGSCPFQSPVCWPPPRAANGTPPPAGRDSSQAEVDKHSCDSSCFKTSMEEVLIKVFKKCIMVRQPCTRMCGACIRNTQESFLWSLWFFLPRANLRVSWMDGNALDICHMQIKAGDAELEGALKSCLLQIVERVWNQGRALITTLDCEHLQHEMDTHTHYGPILDFPTFTLLSIFIYNLLCFPKPPVIKTYGPLLTNLNLLGLFQLFSGSLFVSCHFLFSTICSTPARSPPLLNERHIWKFALLLCRHRGLMWNVDTEHQRGRKPESQPWCCHQQMIWS